MEALGDEYKDYGMVLAGSLGHPIEPRRITGSFVKLI